MNAVLAKVIWFWSVDGSGEMIVGKQEIIEWLVANDDEQNAWEVEGVLPEQLDTDQDRELLEKYGVNVASLLGRRRTLGHDAGGQETARWRS